MTGQGPLIVGLDVGTTNTKAIVFDLAGRPVAGARRPTPMSRPRPGRAEHDPDRLWEVAADTLRATTERLERPDRVTSVAVASMAEAGVPLDASGEALAPVIAWFDDRAETQADRVAARLGPRRLRDITGLRPQPIYGLWKLLWLREHHPDGLAGAAGWANVSDLLGLRLSGTLATDLSLASRTSALDLGTLRWSEAILQAAEVPASLLPEPTWAGRSLGTLTEDAVRATGLPARTTVAVGGHDHVCGALGAGVVAPGQVLDSTGTAESVLAPVTGLPDVGGPAGAGYGCGAHVARDRWYVAGGVHAAGASLDWALELLGTGEQRADLLEEAARVPPGAHGTHFLPQLRSGDGGVVQRGVLLGLTPDTGRAEIVRAVHEGLALAFRETLDAVTAWAGTGSDGDDGPAAVRAIGGGARNRLLLGLKATVLGRPLHRVLLEETTCLGAALLGAVAADLHPDATTAAASVNPGLEEIAPDPGQREHYRTRYRALSGRDFRDLRELLHGGAPGPG